MVLQQQRISLKGSDDRIDYFTELLKSAKNSTELSGAGVLLEASRLWKRSKGLDFEHRSPGEKLNSTRNCYLFVFTPPSDFEFLVNELSSLKTDKGIKRLLQGSKIARSEGLLESLIIVLEYHVQSKAKEWEESLQKDLARGSQPWIPVHDQALKKIIMNEEEESLSSSTCSSPSEAPIMTLKERKAYATELQKYLYIHPPDNLLPPGFHEYEISNRKRLGIDCDEVYPRIFLGNGATLRNINYLQRIGITHVLNAAEFRGVNLSAPFFEGSGITYKGIRIEDTPQTQICRYFSEVSKYIQDVLSSSDRSKVYVNCLFGKSRSTTCIVAYLMIFHGWSALKALSHIRKKRNVLINYGFLNQIADLDHRLKWEVGHCP